MSHKNILNLTILCIYLNERKRNMFAPLAPRVAFGVVLSIQRNQDCNFLFKTNEFRGSPFNIETEEDQIWPMGGGGA